METVEIIEPVKRGRGRPKKGVELDPLTGKPTMPVEKQKKPAGRPKKTTEIAVEEGDLALTLESVLYAFELAGKPLDVIKAPQDGDFVYAIGIPQNSVLMCSNCKHWYSFDKSHKCEGDNGNSTNVSAMDENSTGAG